MFSPQLADCGHPLGSNFQICDCICEHDDPEFIKRYIRPFPSPQLTDLLADARTGVHVSLGARDQPRTSSPTFGTLQPSEGVKDGLQIGSSTRSLPLRLPKIWPAWSDGSDPTNLSLQTRLSMKDRTPLSWLHVKSLDLLRNSEFSQILFGSGFSELILMSFCRLMYNVGKQIPRLQLDIRVLCRMLLSMQGLLVTFHVLQPYSAESSDSGILTGRDCSGQFSIRLC
jgi:hypothetical protein